jgi:hypothetical protein
LKIVLAPLFLVASLGLAMAADAPSNPPPQHVPPANPAHGAPAAPAAAPDDSASITLTFGEFKAIIAAQIAQARAQDAAGAAQAASEKLRTQLTPPAPKEPPKP